MPKERSNHLYQLIKSMSRSEKRYFKLVSNETNTNASKKFMLLFDLIDKQEVFDEDTLLASTKELKPAQFSNLKAHLYKRILQALRQFHLTKMEDAEIREMIDHSELLYNRGLYDQCADILRKSKKKAQKSDHLELLLEILRWEKSLLAHTLDRHNQRRVNKLIQEVQDVNDRINHINTFSNISARLNAFYLKVGYVKSQKDLNQALKLVDHNILSIDENKLSINEKLSLYDLYVGFYYFTHNVEKGYEYALKYLAVFENDNDIIHNKLDLYINAINNVLIGQYKLNKYKDFVNTKSLFRKIRLMNKVDLSENIKMKLLKYSYIHEFNRLFMLGDFTGGVQRLNALLNNIEFFISKINKHSRLILYYKIACLYFGADDFRLSSKWLNRIINSDALEMDVREDVHVFARIVNLICHYEMGNTDLVDYYVKSTYRFMLRKDNLFKFQKYIMGFLKKLSRNMNEQELMKAFKQLRDLLIPLEDDQFEKYPFMYFDIISWLEGKIEKKTVQEIIQSKAKITLGDEYPN
ncbi:hypothetical protein [Flammeovirga kamogawensis]|uniref:Tetratricopeptide repeat protein n=2 Tax=Flammeovirga kamogawensis TaxID=373891 RepID=A0ABX8GZQ9_9BACT|nr:hypothetical protein [Flammeovirga kamogawensis]QWG09099.1 hypothetical protein KM029_09175 [Flammeovirga kamogawensis]TRX67387.1 hypothetical protein EO216_04215 [Flammeovirga kamogawensis]